MIDINLSMHDSTSWVLDTGCGSHICQNVQTLTRSKTLGKGEVVLRLGDGSRVEAIAVGTAVVMLSSGKTLELNNCFVYHH